MHAEEVRLGKDRYMWKTYRGLLKWMSLIAKESHKVDMQNKNIRCYFLVRSK